MASRKVTTPIRCAITGDAAIVVMKTLPSAERRSCWQLAMMHFTKNYPRCFRSEDAADLREHLLDMENSYCCICPLSELTDWGNGVPKGHNPYPLRDYGRCCDRCNEDVTKCRAAIMLAVSDDAFYKKLPKMFFNDEGQETVAILIYDLATKTRNGEPGAYPIVKFPPEKVRMRADGTGVIDLT